MRILFIALAFSLSFSTFAQKPSYDLVISNVNLVDIENNKIIPSMSLFMKDGNIEIIGKIVHYKVPPTKMINGQGKFLMVSLYDMHVHFPDQNAERFFQLQTAAGITNCRIMKSTKETVAFSKMAKNIPAMKISYNFFGNETYKTDSVTTVINSLKAKGYDFIKVFGVKNDEQFDAIMASAKANNMMVCGHALGKINAKKLLASGYKSIEHVGYFDKAKSPESLDTLIDLAVKNNMFVCPTLDWVTMAYHAANKDSFQYRAGYAIGRKLYGTEWDTTYTNSTKQFAGQEKQYKDFADKDIEKKIAILAKMRAKGVKIIAGSDAEEPYQTPGFSLIDELKLIQKAGYTNAELLRMVTTNAKDFFSYNLTNPKTRTLETTNGYILLSKNPLDDINNLGTVEYVIKGNEVIDTKKLLERIK